MKTTHFGTMLLLKDAPARATPLSGRTYIDNLIPLIKESRFSLDVIQYQWNFYLHKKPYHASKPCCKSGSLIQLLNNTVLAAVRRGVKLQVLLNKEGGLPQSTAINQRSHRILSEAGARVKFGRSFPVTHAKMWLIDDDISILGSHNLSERSVTVNDEVSILIRSKEVNQELKRYFKLLFQRT